MVLRLQAHRSDDSPPSKAELKIQWICTSIPTHAFAACAETSLAVVAGSNPAKVTYVRLW